MKRLLGILRLLRGQRTGTIILLEIGGFSFQRFLTIIENHLLFLLLGLKGVFQDFNHFIFLVYRIDIDVHHFASAHFGRFLRHSSFIALVREMQDKQRYHRRQQNTFNNPVNNLTIAIFLTRRFYFFWFR